MVQVKVVPPATLVGHDGEGMLTGPGETDDELAEVLPEEVDEVETVADELALEVAPVDVVPNVDAPPGALKPDAKK